MRLTWMDKDDCAGLKSVRWMGPDRVSPCKWQLCCSTKFNYKPFKNITTMNKIKSPHLKRYKVAEFTAFCLSLQKLVGEQGGAENLGIPASTFAEFENTLAMLSDAVNATQGSDKTSVINDYDKLRDRYFRNVRNVLANLKYSTDPELAALYETAHAKILKVYPASIANEPGQQETAHIAGFVLDVEKFFHSYLSKLGIASALSALTKANEDYQKTYLERSDELAQIEEGATARYRAKLSELYAQMEVNVNYYNALEGAADEDSLARHNACLAFTQVLNEYIDELWQSVKQSRALSKGNTPNAKPNPNSGNGGNSGGGMADLG